MNETKICRVCGAEKEVTEFRKLSAHIGGGKRYAGICKDCERKKRKPRKISEFAPIKGIGNPELAKFTPRELIEELKSRGYKGTLTIEKTVTL